MMRRVEQKIKYILDIPNDWICSKCTLSNGGYRKRCLVCGALADDALPKRDIVPEKEEEVGQQEEEENTTLPLRSENSNPFHSIIRHIDNMKTWQCVKCTYKNNKSVSKCGMCQQNKYDTPEMSTSTLKTVTDITKFCTQWNTDFVDDSFPPILKSIYLNAKCSSKTDVNDGMNRTAITDIRWNSPANIVVRDHRSKIDKKSWTVMDNPKSSDIIQGRLGDCWFLAALALIAENKELMDNIVLTKEISPVGLYVIRLFQHGMWKDVVIDHVLPCNEYNGLLYSRASRKQLWVPLIEKAMAKMHGCYEALVGGNVNEALTVLTGYITELIYWDVPASKRQDVDLEMIWAQLISNFQAGFIMGASCGKSYSDEDMTKESFKSMGLHSHHCYSVLQVVSVNNTRLVRLRNPWGSFSWTGDWSDASNKWTNDLKKLLDPTKAKEGIFWISYSDLLRYFSGVEVCKIRSGWNVADLDGILQPYISGGEYPIYSIDVKETTEVDVALYQHRPRNGKLLRHGPIDLKLVLIKNYNNPSGIEKIAAQTSHRVKPSVNFNAIIPPGKYYLLPLSFNYWSKYLFPDYHIRVHSAKKIAVQRINLPNDYFIADVLIHLALKKGKRTCISDNFNLAVYTMHYSEGWEGSVYVIENKCNVPIKFTWKTTSGTEIKTTRGSLNTFDVLPPMHRQVANILYLETTEADLHRQGQYSSEFRYEIKVKNCTLQEILNQPEISYEMRTLHSQRLIIP